MIFQNSLPHHLIILSNAKTLRKKSSFSWLSQRLCYGGKGGIVALATTFEQALLITLAACGCHAPWNYDATIAIFSF